MKIYTCAVCATRSTDRPGICPDCGEPTMWLSAATGPEKSELPTEWKSPRINEWTSGDYTIRLHEFGYHCYHQGGAFGDAEDSLFDAVNTCITHAGGVYERSPEQDYYDQKFESFADAHEISFTGQIPMVARSMLRAGMIVAVLFVATCLFSGCTADPCADGCISTTVEYETSLMQAISHQNAATQHQDQNQ